MRSVCPTPTSVIPLQAPYGILIFLFLRGVCVSPVAYPAGLYLACLLAPMFWSLVEVECLAFPST